MALSEKSEIFRSIRQPASESDGSSFVTVNLL